MDTHETVTERRSPTAALAQVERPRAVLIGGLGLGFTAARGARRPRGSSGSSWSRSRTRWCGWMRDGTIPARPRAARRRAAARRRRRHPDGDHGGDAGVLRPGAARRRQRPRLPRVRGQRGALRADLPRRGARARCAPAVRSWSGRPTSRPTWRRRWRRCSATSTPIPYDVTLQGRATSATGSTSPALAPSARQVASRPWTATASSTTAWARSRSPQDALWRAQTQRAVENFPISGTRLEAEHVKAMARVKAAAAKVNADLGVITAEQADGDPRRGRRDRRRRAPRPLPDRRVPDRLRHVVEHEHERGARLPRRAGRGRRTPQRPRQRQPVQQRHLPHLDPRRGDPGRRCSDLVPALDHLADALEAQGRRSSPTS